MKFLNKHFWRSLNKVSISLVVESTLYVLIQSVVVENLIVEKTFYRKLSEDSSLKWNSLKMK